MGSASKSIIAVDSSKFDKASFVKFADINDADMIVTENQPDEQWIRKFQAEGVELLY